MENRKFRWSIWLALAATLLAAWLAPDQPEDGITLTAHAAIRSAKAEAETTSPAEIQIAPEAPSQILRIKERPNADFPNDEASPEEQDAHSLFTAPEWGSPPPPPPPLHRSSSSPETPSSPKAPPLPFRFLGRYVENGQTRVFLQEGQQTWIVTAGDTISGAYKVESIEPERIRLVYLPLKQRQTLETGHPQEK